MKAAKLAIIAIFVSLSIGSNYALASVHNVKFMDLITFVCGFLFGPFVGALVGILPWSIYGVLNPFGFVPQIWVATTLSEAIYGVAGGFFHKASVRFEGGKLGHVVFLGSIGFLLTLAYDMLTNVAFAHVFQQSILVAMIVGAPFTLIHEISNALIFGICLIPLTSALQPLVGVDYFGHDNK